MSRRYVKRLLKAYIWLIALMLVGLVVEATCFLFGFDALGPYVRKVELVLFIIWGWLTLTCVGAIFYRLNFTTKRRTTPSFRRG